MSEQAKPIDEAVTGAVRAYLKAGNRLEETAADLKAAIKLAVAEERLSEAQASELTKHFARG